MAISAEKKARYGIIARAFIFGFVFLVAGLAGADYELIPHLLRSMIYFVIGLSIFGWCFAALFRQENRKLIVRLIDLSWSVFSSLAALFAFVALIESFSENGLNLAWHASEQTLRFHRDTLIEELFSVCPDRYPQILHPCNAAWTAINTKIENREIRIAAARNALNSEENIHFPIDVDRYLRSMASIESSKDFVAVQDFSRTNPNGLIFRYFVMVFASLRLSKSLIELWVPKDVD